MAYFTTVSSLNEMIDSSGKNVPSATPEAQQLVGFRRRLDEGRGAERLGHLFGDAAAGADLHAGEILDLVDRPLGVEHLPRAVREHAEQLDALVFADRLKIFPVDARERDRIDFGGGAAARQFGQQRQHMPRRRVARGHVGDVDQAVLDGVESARSGADGCLGSIWNLTRPLVAFSTFWRPDRQHVLGQQVLGGTQLDIVSTVCADAVGCATDKAKRRGKRGEDAKGLHGGRLRERPSRGLRKVYRSPNAGQCSVCLHAAERAGPFVTPASSLTLNAMTSRFTRRLGFVGLGVMGRPMASHLAAAGHGDERCTTPSPAAPPSVAATLAGRARRGHAGRAGGHAATSS